MQKKKQLQVKSYKLQAKRIKPELAGGFRDYGPQDAIMRERLVGKLRKTFEEFGFDPMETPAVERTEVLTGGEAGSQKIIFNVKGSQEKPLDKTRGKQSDLSLRFDLTVPLVRFMAVNPDIPKPFRRYQIGAAWRGESPQAGRYREFLQADIDIVGVSSMDADSEIISVVYQGFKNMGINRFVIKINNRKVLNGLPSYAGFPEKKLPEFLRVIDKKDKIGADAVKKEIVKTFKKQVAEKIEQFLAISGDTREKLLQARDLLKGSGSTEEGIKELAEIVRNIKAAGIEQKNWEIDFSVVRGLNYYTGPIFETVLLDAAGLGSVCSGGRYDELTIPYTGEKLPTVGVSFGVDRLFAALDELKLLKKKATTTKVLILTLAPELKQEYFAFAKTLRDANINTALYVGDDRAFQAQLAYAVKKEIPYVVIYGDAEQKKGVVTIKNLERREQKEIPKAELLAQARNLFR
ncbi:MAG: histidine--tRNA ligase [Candidatus Sungbacteria bacterium RIFCSPHIGHO2_02_FULL_47_11]|uniref:Histidine--tRNA ligase n=1 Tax=Candidatus Sungbacteria bacterium RIFCSPHIGHO2_02_FULL_47_11 TaxID=1802270 RepID=A0A1G2KM24_9BACT|nr:MAG: histidine--tRNA ligase [Candidatus Sungbacteria bacterium RIFCSPHIGHO2_02_FULL_47_11]